MNHRRWLVIGALLLALVIAFWIWRPRQPVAPAAQTAAESPTAADAEATREPIPVDLYFPNRGSRLTIERRLLNAGGDPESRIRAIIALLQRGPEDPALSAPLPPDLELLAVYLGDDGVAYLDFGLPQQAPSSTEAPPADAGSTAASAPPGPAVLQTYGSTQEMQAVYSLVNSLVTNLPEVGWVVLLWNGMQRPTFAGHLDTSRPLAAKLDLVENRP